MRDKDDKLNKGELIDIKSLIGDADGGDYSLDDIMAEYGHSPRPDQSAGKVVPFPGVQPPPAPEPETPEEPELPEEPEEPEEAEAVKEETTFWDRVVRMFQDLWDTLTGIFR